MGIQVQTTNTNVPFFLGDDVFIDGAQTLLTNGARATVLKQFTLMAKVAATGKWVPFTDETATDGTAIPQGILVSGDVTAAALVAGDVADAQIARGGCVLIDGGLLTIENSKTLSTVIVVGEATASAQTDQRTVRDHLITMGFFPTTTDAISSAER